jgi:hypothetical protein
MAAPAAEAGPPTPARSTPRQRRIERKLVLVAALLQVGRTWGDLERATISAADPHTNATKGGAQSAAIPEKSQHFPPS